MPINRSPGDNESMSMIADNNSIPSHRPSFAEKVGDGNTMMEKLCPRNVLCSDHYSGGHLLVKNVGNNVASEGSLADIVIDSDGKLCTHKGAADSGRHESAAKLMTSRPEQW